MATLFLYKRARAIDFIQRLFVVHGAGFSTVRGDECKAMAGQIVFCTCALQPDDSSSDRSLFRSGFLFATHSDHSISVLPRSRYLLLSPPDVTALSSLFSRPLPCLPAIAPEVSSTPACLQADVIASRGNLQRPAPRMLSRSTTSDIIRNCVESFGGTLFIALSLCLQGAVLYVTLGNTYAGTCTSETIVSGTSRGHTQREWWP